MERWLGPWWVAWFLTNLSWVCPHPEENSSGRWWLSKPVRLFLGHEIHETVSQMHCKAQQASFWVGVTPHSYRRVWFEFKTSPQWGRNKDALL
jgi:hypothetical protein